MCRAAFAKGFESIGFSSHAPAARKIGFETGWHLPEEKLPRYIEEVLEARKRWEGRLKVYLGLEVDHIRGICGPADKDIQELPLDYVIGAVHYVISPKNGELFSVDGPEKEFGPGLKLHFDNDGAALCAAYYGMYASLIRNGGCDILAHMDLIKKNNRSFRFFSPADPAYGTLLRETADLAAAASGPGGPANGSAAGAPEDRRPIVEVNTGGLIRGRTADCYPSPELLGLLWERNVPLTINADAHAPEHLGGGYERARQDMIRAGYSTMLLFGGRKNGRALWREEPL
jgi:histidinol-phosphatase (PHP family)